MSPDSVTQAPAPKAWAWRVVVFMASFALLQLGWQASQDLRIKRLIVDDATVKTAAALINRLTPSVHARSINTAIHSPGGGINVINGCEGVEALLLLIAAFLVAPIRWRSRVCGLLCGLPFVFIVNQMRILTLFYAHRGTPALFDFLHGTVTPVVVILLVCGYYYAWLGSVPHAAATTR